MSKYTSLNRVHYADDRTACTSNNSLTYLTEHLYSELFKINDFLCATRLSVNAAKFNFHCILKTKFTLHTIFLYVVKLFNKAMKLDS